MSSERRRRATGSACARVGAGAASGLVLASGLTVPTVAEGREWELRGDGGVFVAFHFGGPSGVDVGLGMEARAAYVDVTQDCGGAQQLFTGLVARLEVLDFKRTRLTTGPVLGRGNGGWGFAGEVTGGVALGKDPGPIVHLGAEGAGLFLLNARVGYTVMRDWEAGVGLRFPPITWTIACAIGRPLRGGGARTIVQGAEGALPPGPAAAPRDTDRLRASSIWMRRACLEWASVPAFCELAEQLKVCGASPALVSKAREAAAEELGHAILSAEVAASLGGMSCVSLDPPVTEPRAAAGGVEGLRRLVLESWLDGCVGERASSLIAARESAHASDPAIARAQALIAAQESGHAELAWEVVEWALGADRASARPLLATCAASPRATNAAGLAATSGDELDSFGIAAATAADRLQDRARAEARGRLADRLAG